MHQLKVISIHFWYIFTLFNVRLINLCPEKKQTGLNIVIGIVSPIPIAESFWQKDSLKIHTF